MNIKGWFASLYKRPAPQGPQAAKPAASEKAVPSRAEPDATAASKILFKKTAIAKANPHKSINELEEIEVLERYVVFKAGELWLGLDIGEISEVVTEFSITPVPQVPDYVEGVMSLRGEMIPIVHLAARLDLEVKEVGEATRIVVLKEPHVKVGFMVDEMREIVKVEHELVIDIPRFIADIKIPHHFLKKATLYKEELLFILDANEVLAKDAPKELFESITVGHPERSQGSDRVNRGKKVA